MLKPLGTRAGLPSMTRCDDRRAAERDPLRVRQPDDDRRRTAEVRPAVGPGDDPQRDAVDDEAPADADVQARVGDGVAAPEPDSGAPGRRADAARFDPGHAEQLRVRRRHRRADEDERGRPAHAGQSTHGSDCRLRKRRRRRERPDAARADEPAVCVERAQRAVDLVVEARTDAREEQREAEHEPGGEQRDRESSAAPPELPQADEQSREHPARVFHTPPPLSTACIRAANPL
jgi:hypothetical protein